MFRWHYTNEGEYPKVDCEEVFCEAQNRRGAVLIYYKDHDAKKAGQFVDFRSDGDDVSCQQYEED